MFVDTLSCLFASCDVSQTCSRPRIRFGTLSDVSSVRIMERFRIHADDCELGRCRYTHTLGHYIDRHTRTPAHTIRTKERMTRNREHRNTFSVVRRIASNYRHRYNYTARIKWFEADSCVVHSEVHVDRSRNHNCNHGLWNESARTNTEPTDKNRLLISHSAQPSSLMIIPVSADGPATTETARKRLGNFLESTAEKVHNRLSRTKRRS